MEAPVEVIKTVEVVRMPYAGEVVAATQAVSSGFMSYPAPDYNNQTAMASVPSTSPAERLIIKNADLILEVEDPEATIDQVSQITAELGGYIVSSQVSVQQLDDITTKFATIKLAVPAANFEESLRKLRSLAVLVRNETILGQDATEEYVDLDSRLTNLKATRDRIRQFMDDAKTVEEALKVNEQLSQVEGEIEQIQGRMNYLFERAANSSIIVQIMLYRPSDQVNPYPTPEPWSPMSTVADAAGLLGASAQRVVDSIIYLVILIIPLAVPLVGMVWLARKLWKRFQR